MSFISAFLNGQVSEVANLCNYEEREIILFNSYSDLMFGDTLQLMKVKRCREILYITFENLTREHTVE